MSGLEAYRRRIAASYPDLRFSVVQAVPGGQNSDVIVVDGEWLFRFPRYPAGAARLGAEGAVLRALRGRVSLPVPAPQYVNLSPVPGEAFLGYRLLPGEPLQRDSLSALASDARARITRQLACFLQELHAVPPEAVGWPLPDVGTPEQIRAMAARVEELLVPRMRPDARRTVTARFAALADAVGRSAPAPRLVHGDFGAGNILLDDERAAVSGVVDFGSAGLGDPARDLAGLLAGFGESFLGRVVEAAPSLAPLVPRAHLYAGTFALEEALFGLDTGDADALRSGLAPFV